MLNIHNYLLFTNN